MLASAWKKYGKSEEDTECGFGINLGGPNRLKHFKGLKAAVVEIGEAV